LRQDAEQNVAKCRGEWGKMQGSVWHNAGQNVAKCKQDVIAGQNVAQCSQIVAKCRQNVAKCRQNVAKCRPEFGIYGSIQDVAKRRAESKNADRL
jgi:hypothetical protein